MRPALRLAQAFRATRPRLQQITSGAAAAKPVPPIKQNVLRRLWESPVGMKTVHFWAPVLKWGLVIAGISDFARPAESLSLPQNFALMCTGMIWTRWCLIIKPKNIFLATVNFFLGIVGLVQVGRIGMYNYSVKQENPVSAEVEKLKQEAKKITS